MIIIRDWPIRAAETGVAIDVVMDMTDTSLITMDSACAAAVDPPRGLLNSEHGWADQFVDSSG